MLANMAASLIKHKRINTTLQKARALKIYVEPLLTKSKDDTTNSRRVVFGYLQDKYAVTELFREIAPKIANRPGGYTRILKLGNRLGDNADMVMMELVDFNEAMLKDSKTATKKTTRRAGKKTTTDPKTEKAEKVVKEEVKEVVEKEEEEVLEAAPEVLEAEEVKAEE
ncbi:50S ribosomal protein L17 [Bacteroidia bacterium]|nr:50S ribosomal protein L17 [Bacteroidia bacterium]